MRPPRYKLLVEKSLDACLAAIEIYNKPNFQYREEAFSILVINAWELLLKARIVQQNSGSLRSIEVREPRVNKDGSKSKLQQRKLNRSGNSMTISLNRAAGLVRSYSANGIDVRCAENLNLLQEIRDNAIHLYNVSPGLGKRIQEVGSATLKNFVAAAEKWFVAAAEKWFGTMEVQLKFVRTAGQDALPVERRSALQLLPYAFSLSYAQRNRRELAERQAAKGRSETLRSHRRSGTPKSPE